MANRSCSWLYGDSPSKRSFVFTVALRWRIQVHFFEWFICSFHSGLKWLLLTTILVAHGYCHLTWPLGIVTRQSHSTELLNIVTLSLVTIHRVTIHWVPTTTIATAGEQCMTFMQLIQLHMWIVTGGIAIRTIAVWIAVDNVHWTLSTVVGQFWRLLFSSLGDLVELFEWHCSSGFTLIVELFFIEVFSFTGFRLLIGHSTVSNYFM